MYLEYSEFQQMGGNLDSSAFALYERRAENLINSQAAGQTGTRIAKLTELPSAIKECVFDLVMFLSSNADYNRVVTSESQSSGGVSESVSYNVMDATQINAQIDDIIYNGFYGGGVGDLLYRGVDI